MPKHLNKLQAHAILIIERANKLYVKRFLYYLTQRKLQKSLSVSYIMHPRKRKYCTHIRKENFLKVKKRDYLKHGKDTNKIKLQGSPSTNPLRLLSCRTHIW